VLQLSDSLMGAVSALLSLAGPCGFQILVPGVVDRWYEVVDCRLGELFRHRARAVCVVESVTAGFLAPPQSNGVRGDSHQPVACHAQQSSSEATRSASVVTHICSRHHG
jgi:hypothetical protein